MKCEDCSRFESCKIVSDMENLRYEILRAKNNLQAVLSQSPKELRDKYADQQKQLTKRRLELRRKQSNCLRKRCFLYYHGYPCFKHKRREKENRDEEDNQKQVLDSYF